MHGVSRVPRRSEHGGPVRWWQGNIEDVDDTRTIWDASRPDIVYHMSGAINGAPTLDLLLPCYHSLLTTTVNLLSVASAAGSVRLVLTGSLEDEDYPGAVGITSSPYAAAKTASLQYARMCHAAFGAPVVVVRTFMAYGPGQPQWKLIPSVISALRQGDAPRLSSGERKLDWVYINDVIDAYVAAGSAPGIEGHTFDVGSGELTSIRGIVERLTQIIDPTIQPRFGELPDRPARAPRKADIEFTARYLGWSPKTSLADGLSKTVKFLEERCKALHQ